MTNSMAWMILFRVVVVVFAALMLLFTAAWVQYPDGSRSLNVAGLMIDAVAVVMISWVAWSLRPGRTRPR